MSLYARAVFNDAWKHILVLWSYRLNFVTWSVTTSIVYIGLALLAGDGDIERFESRASWLVGFALWLYSVSIIETMAWGLREETLHGTMEQMALGQASTPVLLVGRVLGSVIMTTGQIAVVACVSIVLLRFSVPLTLAALPVLALILMGLLGYGLLIAGLVLVFKQIEAVAGGLINMMLFVNGALVAVHKFPPGVELLVRVLPTTEGLIVLREIMFDGLSLAQTLRDGHLATLLLHAGISLGLGAGVFRWCEREARRRGTLGQY